MDLHEDDEGFCSSTAFEEDKGEDEINEAEEQSETGDKTLREEIIALYNKGQKHLQFVTISWYTYVKCLFFKG